MALTRREACMMIPALMAAAKSYADEKPTAQNILKSATYNFNDLHPIKSADHTTYPMLKGETRTGTPLELHETELQPGAQPHPPHHHLTEELFLVRDGLVEVTIGDKSTKLAAGSAAYIASNVVHGIRNVGDRPARYFVMQLD